MALVLVGIAVGLGVWQYDAWQAHRDAKAEHLTHAEPVPINDCQLSVDRANGLDVGYHFRLLARVQGRPAAGAEMFAGPEWATVGG